MRPRSGLSSTDFDNMVDQYFIQVEGVLFGEDWLDCYATAILDAKYEFTDVTEVVTGFSARAYICAHLNNKHPCENRLLRNLMN